MDSRALKNLTKQQKQLAFLILLVLVGAIFSLKEFVLTPLMASWTDGSADLEELSTKLHQADLTIRSENKIRNLLIETEKDLRTAERDLIPVLDNPLAWASEKIYEMARKVQIEVESVSEMGVSKGTPVGKDEERPVFAAYPVRVLTKGSYEKIRELIEVIETTNPYVAITGISIAKGSTSVEKHTARLIVEWPIWVDDAGPALIESLDKPAGKRTLNERKGKS